MEKFKEIKQIVCCKKEIIKLSENEYHMEIINKKIEDISELINMRGKS